MMNGMSNILINILSIFYICGCADTIDRNSLPPSDAQWVNVEIKNPSQYTKPFPLEVVYISHKCMKSSINGVDGSREEKPSYNGVKIPLQQQGNSDLWHVKVAMNGGGSCDWTLSEFNLGIEYIDATHLGKNLVPGTPVGATIAFDDDAARNGRFFSAHGNINLSPNYYPYIIEWNINKKQKELSLLGAKDFLSVRAYDSSEVKFEPHVDEKKVVRFIEPEKKIDGVSSRIIYLDGTIAPNGTLFPDFNKVDKMKI